MTCSTQKHSVLKMEWPTAAQLFGSEPLPTIAVSEQLQAPATSAILPNISTLCEVVQEEVALEGLDGITFATLLQRLIHREDFTGDVFTPEIRTKVFRCLQSSPHVSFCMQNFERPDLVEQCYDERIADERTMRYTTLLNAENEIVDRNALVMPPPLTFAFSSSQSSIIGDTQLEDIADDSDTTAGDNSSVTTSSFATSIASSTLDAVMACEKLAAVSLHAAYPYYPLHRSKEGRKLFSGKDARMHLGSCAEYFTRILVEKHATESVDEKDAENLEILNNNKLVIVASRALRWSILTQCSKWMDCCFTPDGYVMLEYLGRCRSRATFTSANCLFNWDPKCRAQDVHYFIDTLLRDSPVIIKQFQFHAARNICSSYGQQLSQHGLVSDDEQQQSLPSVKTSSYAHRLLLLRFFSRTGNSLDHFILNLINRLRNSPCKWVPRRVMQAEYGDKLVKYIIPQLSFIKSTVVDKFDVERCYPGLFSDRFGKSVVCFQYMPAVANEACSRGTSSQENLQSLRWLLQASLLTPIVNDKKVNKIGSQDSAARTAVGSGRTITQNPSLNDAYSMACAALNRLPSVFTARKQPYELLQRRGRREFSTVRELTGARLQPRDISAICEQSMSCSRQLYRGIVKEIGLQDKRKKKQQQKMLTDENQQNSIAIVPAAATVEEVDDVSLPVDEQQLAQIAAQCVKYVQDRTQNVAFCLERNDWVALVCEYMPADVRADWKAVFQVAVAVLERVMSEYDAVKLSFMAFESSASTSSASSVAASPFEVDEAAVMYERPVRNSSAAAEQFLYAAVSIGQSVDAAETTIAHRKLRSIACDQRLRHKLRQCSNKNSVFTLAGIDRPSIAGLRPTSAARLSPMDDLDGSSSQQIVAVDQPQAASSTGANSVAGSISGTGFLFHSLPESVKDDYNAHENVNYPRVFQYKALHHFLLTFFAERFAAVDAAQQNRRFFVLYNDVLRAVPTGILIRLAARSLRAEFFAGFGSRSATGWWMPINCRRMLAHESTQRIPYGQLPLLLRQAVAALFDKTLKRTLLELMQIGIIRLVSPQAGNADESMNDDEFFLPIYKIGVSPMNNYTRIILHKHYYFIDTTYLCRTTATVKRPPVDLTTEIVAAPGVAAAATAASADADVICYRELTTHTQVENLWIDLTELSRVTEQRPNSALNYLDRRAAYDVLTSRLKQAAEGDARWSSGAVGYPRVAPPSSLSSLSTSSSVPGPCGIDAAIRLQNARLAFLPAYRVQELMMPITVMRTTAAGANILMPSTGSEIKSRVPIAYIPEWDMPLARSSMYRNVEQNIMKEAKSKKNPHNAPVAIPDSVCRRIRAYIDDMRANRVAQVKLKERQKKVQSARKIRPRASSPEAAFTEFNDAEPCVKVENLSLLSDSDDDDDYNFLIKFEKQQQNKEKKRKILPMSKPETTAERNKKHKAKFHTTWIRQSRPNSFDAEEIDTERRVKSPGRKLSSEGESAKSAQKNTLLMTGPLASIAFRNLFVPWQHQAYYSTNDNCSSFSPAEQAILVALAITPQLLSGRTQMSPHLFSFVCRSALLPDCFSHTTLLSLRRAWACMLSVKSEVLVKQCLEVARQHPIMKSSSLFKATSSKAILLSTTKSDVETDLVTSVLIPTHKKPPAISRDQLHSQLLYAYGVGLCANVLLSHMSPNTYADIMYEPATANNAAVRAPKTQIISAGMRHIIPHAGMGTLDDVQRGLVVSFIIAYASAAAVNNNSSLDWHIQAPRLLAAMRRHPAVLNANFLQQRHERHQRWSSVSEFTAAQNTSNFYQNQQQFVEGIFKRTVTTLKRMNLIAYIQKILRNQAARLQNRQQAACDAENRQEGAEKIGTESEFAEVAGRPKDRPSAGFTITGYMTTATFNTLFEPGSTSRRLSAALSCQNVCDEIQRQIKKNAAQLSTSREVDSNNKSRFATPRLAILRSILSACSGDDTFFYNFGDEIDDENRSECFASRDGVPVKPGDIALGAISRRKDLDASYRIRNMPRTSISKREGELPSAATFMRSLPFNDVTKLCYEDLVKARLKLDSLVDKFEAVTKADETIFPLTWCDSVSGIRSTTDGVGLMPAATQTARLAVINWVAGQQPKVAQGENAEVPPTSKCDKIVDVIMNVLADIMLTAWRGATLNQLAAVPQRSAALCRKAVRALLDCKLLLRTGTGADDSDGASVSYVSFPYAQDHLMTSFIENDGSESREGAAGEDFGLRRTHYYEPRPWKNVGIEQRPIAQRSATEEKAGPKPGQCDRASVISYYRAVSLALDQARLTVAQFSNIVAVLAPKVQPFHVRVLLEQMSQINMVALSASSSDEQSTGIYADQSDFLVELLPQAVANLFLLEKHYEVYYCLPQH